MTDNLEFLPQSENLPDQLAFEHIRDSEQETVTVELPVDVLAALDRQVDQSGQSQTQVILEALRSALGLGQTPFPSNSVEISTPAELEQTEKEALVSLAAEVEHLKHRLHQLEALIPKIEDLAGKSIAF